MAFTLTHGKLLRRSFFDLTKLNYNLSNKLKSKDGSINYIFKHKLNSDSNPDYDPNSMIECRYVRRNKSYISAYVSSHTGCKMGCKFCWLTQSNQTSFKHVELEDYNQQLYTILTHTPDEIRNRKNIRVNINFMSRGEALANKVVINNYRSLYDNLEYIAKDNYYEKIKINISSIFPTVVNNKILEDIFKDRPVNIYYSIYSINDIFRKEFIPNAMDVRFALDKLKSFQNNHNSDNTVVFHCAFIRGENDNIEDVQKMADLIKSYNFKNTKFNLVRLNPFIKDNKPLLLESDLNKLKDIFNIMNDCVTNQVPTQKSRIINRIGTDVFASCGMFDGTGIDMDVFDKLIHEVNDYTN